MGRRRDGRLECGHHLSHYDTYAHEYSGSFPEDQNLAKPILSEQMLNARGFIEGCSVDCTQGLMLAR